jgi:hypothetical protein
MVDPKWPSYPIGPTESIFALGVASIKYAELESSLIFIFLTVLGIDRDLATMIHARVGSEACIKLIEQILPPLTMIGPPTRDVFEIRYFIKVFQICTENRNHFMHSGIAILGGREETLLFKTSKQGKTIIAMRDFRELRQVADDMNACHLYGRALGNAINARLGGGAPVLPFPWPDRPPLPHRLDYTSDPIQLRSSHQAD